MKKLLLFGALTLLLAGGARALDCTQALNDSTGKLNSALVLPELGRLQAEGVDAKVLVIGPTSNLDFDEQAVERGCLEWRSPNGGRKSTLLVLSISPEGHKAGIYYGRALEHALAGQWPRILHDYMAPSFKTGDFNTGTVLGLQQLAARIQASRSEALTPAQTTVNNQAADLSGLWSVLGWMLFLLALGTGGYFLHAYFKRKAEDADAVGEAQTRAVQMKNTAAALINAGRDSGMTSPAFERCAEDFARLAGNFQTDPETPNLSAAQYRVLEEGYAEVVRRLRGAPLDTVPTVVPAVLNGTGGHVHHGHTRRVRPVHSTRSNMVAPVIINTENNYGNGAASAPASASSSNSSDSSSNDDGGSVDFGSGSGSSDGSSDSSSDSGGSSSWSSDSSSGDSGGSSSWDSGSSGGGDFGGGGGSSDF